MCRWVSRHWQLAGSVMQRGHMMIERQMNHAIGRDSHRNLFVAVAKSLRDRPGLAPVDILGAAKQPRSNELRLFAFSALTGLLN